jgi:hypothetical protein
LINIGKNFAIFNASLQNKSKILRIATSRLIAGNKKPVTSTGFG